MTGGAVRVIVHATVPGIAVRVRLEHTLGLGPATFDAASLGLPNAGASLVSGSVRPRGSTAGGA